MVKELEPIKRSRTELPSGLYQVCSLANFAGNFQQACFLPVLATSYSTKCGKIWSPHGYYQMWLLLHSTKYGNIWGTHGYYYFCTPPNVATSVPMDSTKCGYFCTPPNVATFGVPMDINYQMWLLLYSTKCGNIWSTHGY